MSAGLVTVAQFANPADAHLARMMLEASQIQSFLIDEHLGGFHSVNPLAHGGIKLQIRPDDLDEALEVLSEAPCGLPHQQQTETLRTCPNCGCVNVSDKNISRGMILLSLLLLGLPLLFLTRTLTCETCAHQWKG